MNYFDLFGIEPQLKVDKEAIRKRYLELSRRYHPGSFSRASAYEQQKAENNTALLNEAFKTFNNSDETIRYLLELKGVLKDGSRSQRWHFKNKVAAAGAATRK